MLLSSRHIHCPTCTVLGVRHALEHRRKTRAPRRQNVSIVCASLRASARAHARACACARAGACAPVRVRASAGALV
eukprot:7480744-Alexandrium_andersonii.AAC.1